MRSGQQNKRSRGRGNNNSNGFNRKGANPLTRTYDSNGPDVKVRGTAQHIAEKYMTLARDAQGAGDRVVAENYLQHAEHYIRIIAAAQAQMQERYQRDERSDNNSDDNNNDDAASGRNNAQQNGQDSRNSRKDNAPQKQDQQPVDANGPQPVIDGTPAEVAAESSDGQSVEKPRNTRRRTSTAPRPRRTKRVSAEAGSGDDATGAANADEGSNAPAAEEQSNEAAPKRPARRKRTPKAEAKEQTDDGKSEQPALVDAPGE